ncbi:MAG TPA: PQQ-binding-like beta-propeller repeat protein [Candidatus Baltobacteraceae bacterium]|jgi:outer membrane protein assembly factor BamB|nr:PQQ-binding-like beta-propeller repeat protein [Candidatus Baltobacteraceae bacterium]
MIRQLQAGVLAAGLVFANTIPSAGAGWPVFGYDPARSGVDGSRRILTVRNVVRLRSRWQISLGAIADSTPILLEHIKAGGISRTMLFQTATNGVTFGIDAQSGQILWRFRTRGTSLRTGGVLGFLRNAVFGPSVTTSTPAADPAGRSIYAPGLDGFVHKLDAATGTELIGRGFPVRITLIPQTEKDASALNLANGYLYATTSGYNGDAPPYVGHVISVRLADGSTTVFNSLCGRDRRLPTPTSCPHSGSGIWSRGGVVVDPDASMHGRIYVATGDGDFDADSGGDDYGDSVLALNPALTKLVGRYTPADYGALSHHDVDLGSTSPAILPRQPASRTPLMLIQGGKDSVLKLVNRSPLPGVAGELQRLDLVAPLFSTPAVWTERSNRVWIFMGFPQEVDGYRLDTDALGESRLVRIWRAAPGKTSEEGTSPVVSNGIVFDAFDGAIFALDARNGHELWNSRLQSAGRTIGPVHWQSPIVVNGWVYCSDQNGDLTAYALH